jgi:hypothetical protein
MNNQKTFIFCAFLCITLLCACFSTWDGSGGTGKVALKPGTPGVEEYTVILTSPGRSSIESEPTRDSTIIIDVPPGIWDIAVREEGPEGLTALGEEKVEVKSGETSTVHVKMIPAAQVKKGKKFSDAFKYFEDLELEDDDLCYIEIAESITVDEPVILNGGKNITLRADKNVTISRGNVSTEALFRISRGSKLTLGGKGRGKITINGDSENESNEPLIAVSGELIMNEGVTLEKNKLNSSSFTYNHPGGGGGVHLYSGGIFTMKGGSISGNTTNGYGGGVYVDDGGKFFMEGGDISNNKSSPDSYAEYNVGGGGGVYVHSGGEFTMKDGKIHDNTTNGHGGGVRLFGEYVGTEYKVGTFLMEGGIISDNKSEGSSNAQSGGIRVRGIFTMTGGTISGNSAPSGGGIGVADNDTNNGTFIMKGGTISGNEATSGDGGGIRVYSRGTFTKTGGTIYGKNDNSLQNIAKGNGQAVYAQNGNTIKFKNTTAGPGNNLSYSYPGGTFSEGWDQ